MSPLESLNFYAKAFFCLSPKQKDICRLLYSMEIAKRKGKFTSVYPSKRKIANLVKCSTRTVKRFNREANGLLMEIKKRLDMSRNARQTTNAYEMDREMFNALHWLDRNNLLYASKRAALRRLNKATILEETGQDLSPSPVRICPPIILNPLIKKKEEYQEGYIHPLIDKIKMAPDEKIRASRYSEHCIVRSIEDAIWYRDKGNKINDAAGFMISRLEKWKRRNL